MLMLADAAGAGVGVGAPSWGAIFAVIALASGVPSTLIAWLHVRVNAMQKEHRDETQRLEGDIESVRQEIFSNLNARFATKETVNAELRAVSDGIQGLHKRMGDVMQGILDIQKSSKSQGERLARLEAVGSK